MRELEQRFPDEVVVVGVHSGKYTAERVTSRILEATWRLDAVHPVVNDRQFRTWRAYAVRAWPTLVVIDPSGYVVGQHAGEFTADAVAEVVRELIARAEDDGTLDRAPKYLPPTPAPSTPGVLRYPGKVAVQGHRLAIADSGHHRVLVGTLDAGRRMLRVTQVIGRGAPGLVDGSAAEAAFTNPQGLALDGDVLFVADAGNHAVRRVELETGTVRTLAGTGRRMRTQADRDAGAMASPWDLVCVDGMLHVAMAGTHQLWSVNARSGAAVVHAGRGGEDIADAALREALLAQPMGIATHGDRLWFADAETSAVRWADLTPDGNVGTVVGTGLFDFGDQDGTGDDVRLQHPQGIAVHPADGRLLVSDSYNDALKWVDPATRAVTTWARDFHEPAGIAIDADGRVFVADTNAHRILVLAEGERWELEVAAPPGRRRAGPGGWG